jgi:hypothetical protein
MRQPRLYFCYRFDVSVVNSLTLSITYVGCHLVFINDFKVYSYCLFAGDIWISCDIAFLTIPCVSHDSIFAIDWMHQSWIQWHFDSLCRLSLNIHWRFQVLQGLCFRWRFMDHQWQRFWHFHASTMTLFLLSIWCLGPEFIDAIDYIHRLSLSINWRFQGLQLLCFRWRFMDQPWHSVFDNFMHHPWLYFCYRLSCWTRTLFSLTIYGSTMT